VRDDAGPVTGVVARGAGGEREHLPAGAVVLAASGFEFNSGLRAAHLGPNWDVAKVRGTLRNTGEVLEAALRHGAEAYGHGSGCHAIQWDASAPPTGDPGDHEPLLAPVLSRRDRREPARERIVDEGEDLGRRLGPPRGWAAGCRRQLSTEDPRRS
jgi:hypothetical protein